MVLSVFVSLAASLLRSCVQRYRYGLLVRQHVLDLTGGYIYRALRPSVKIAGTFQPTFPR